MITRKRTRQPDVAEADPIEGQPADLAADTTDHDGPLTDSATAADIAAAAERYRQAEADALERAGRDDAEAERLLAERDERIAAITAEFETAVQPLRASAGCKRGDAGKFGDTDRALTKGAGLATTAEASAARVKALEDEREHLTAELADLGKQLAELAAKRAEADAKHAAASDDGDFDRMTELRNLMISMDDRAGQLTAERDDAQSSLDAIGDGTETFTSHPLLRVLPLLAEARRVADMDRHLVHGALNDAFPGRPEAVADRKRQHEQELDRLDSEQFAERAASSQPGARTVLSGPQGQVVVRRG